MYSTEYDDKYSLEFGTTRPYRSPFGPFTLPPDFIMNEAERFVNISWSLLVLFASIIGDSIILIATIKYNAIRQHKMIIAAMQHMAVCDLLQTVLRVFPNTLASITGRWILGELLCHVEAIAIWPFGVLTMLLTCCMTTIKLIIVKRPLRARTLTTKLGHIICAAMWFLALCWYIPMLVGNIFYGRLYFSPEINECNYYYMDDWYSLYLTVALPVTNTLCNITLIVTSILLLIIACRAASRHKRSVNWAGISTVLLTVMVFLVSYLPVSALATGLGVYVSYTVWRVAFKIQYLNIMANFFIYSLTVPSFRQFLKLKMSELLALLRQCNRQREPLTQRRRPNPTQAAAPTQNILINPINVQDTAL